MNRLPASPFLYPILDTAFGENIVRDAIALMDAGIKIFQVRAKDWNKARIFETVSSLVPQCIERKVILIVNDFVDVAMITENVGVHLGQNDFPTGEARKLLLDRIIGISTHDERQFLIANAGAVDYIAIGPMYRSSTKPEAGPGLGTAFLESMRKASKLPIVCIGGIGPSQFRDLVHAGADGIAMISELYRGKDLYSSARRLMDQLQSATCT